MLTQFILSTVSIVCTDSELYHDCYDFMIECVPEVALQVPNISDEESVDECERAYFGVDYWKPILDQSMR
jgi:hypothetical protein